MSKVKLIEKLKAQILLKRPILAELFKQYAGISVGEYERLLKPSEIKVAAERKQEFIKAVSSEVLGHFFPVVAAAASRQLEMEYMVSTAEHHGPLTHPFFVHSNLLAAAGPREAIIVLAVGNVSLNNSSYPRGLVYHSADGREHRLPFFPWRESAASVFGHRAFNQTDLNKLEKHIQSKVKNSELLEPAAAAILEIIRQIYGQAEILGLPDYNHQITRTNDLLWKSFFSRSGFQPPLLLTLQLEDIVINLLQQHHLFSNTEIFDLIFNSETHKKLQIYADGIPGNFSLKEKKGTFLFWHVSPSVPRRQALWPKDGYLESTEGYRLKLNPESVNLALQRGELIPGTFLSLLLLSEYYGVKCLGGFSQGTYLTKMHQAYNLMRGSLAENFNPEHSSGLRSDFVLGYFKDSSGHLQAASGLDLALHHNREFWKIFSETVNRLNLEQAMAPLFPELYRALYSSAEQEEELSKISTSDIINFYKLSDKVTPFIKITL